MKKIIYDEDGTVQLINDSSEIVKEVKPGFYKAVEERSLFSSAWYMRVDNSVKIPNFDNNNPELLGKIIKWFSPVAKEISSSIGFIHKMGILLYGKFGCGKTTFCYQVGEWFIKHHDTICIQVNTERALNFAIEFSKHLRTDVGFDKPIVMIMDECENYMDQYESAMKAILDSNSSLDNCLMLFTTNYIDQIPDAIKNRPSRIKECIEFKGEDDEIRIHRTLQALNTALPEELRIPKGKVDKLVSTNVAATIDDVKHAFLELAIAHNEALLASALK